MNESFADDLGYGDITAYGQPCHPAVPSQHVVNTNYTDCPPQPTPRIDQMAAEGIRFNNFYAAHPVRRYGYRALYVIGD